MTLREMAETIVLAADLPMEIREIENLEGGDEIHIRHVLNNDFMPNLDKQWLEIRIFPYYDQFKDVLFGITFWLRDAELFPAIHTVVSSAFSGTPNPESVQECGRRFKDFAERFPVSVAYHNSHLILDKYAACIYIIHVLNRAKSSTLFESILADFLKRYCTENARYDNMVLPTLVEMMKYRGYKIEDIKNTINTIQHNVYVARKMQ